MSLFHHLYHQCRQLDWSHPGSWPAPAHYLAIALLSLIITLSSLGWFAWPAHENLRQARQQEQQLHRIITRHRHRIAHLDSYRKRQQKLSRALDTQREQLPTQSDMADLLDQITHRAKSHQIETRQFKSRPEQPRRFDTVSPWQLSLRGRFHPLMHFIADVLTLPWLVTIRDLDIRRTTEEHILHMQLTVNIHRRPNASAAAANAPDAQS